MEDRMGENFVPWQFKAIHKLFVADDKVGYGYKFPRSPRGEVRDGIVSWVPSPIHICTADLHYPNVC